MNTESAAPASGFFDSESEGRLTATGRFESDEIDLSQIWDVLWGGKWIILAVTLVFAVSSVIYALSLPDKYQAKSLLVPVSSDGGGAGGLASQYGGLAAMAGINLKSGGDNKVAIAVALVNDWNFIEQFIYKYELQVPIVAGIGWDRASQKLVLDEELYDAERGRWVDEGNEVNGPSSWEMYQSFASFVSISEDMDTGLISLGIEYYSPVLAEEWNRLLVKEVNQYMRLMDILEAKANIEYLKKQIESTSVSDLQSVFYRLIEEQTKTLMLAKASDQYVLKIIGPAKAPEKKSGPVRSKMCISATLTGGLFGIALVFAWYLFNKRRLGEQSSIL